MRKFDLSLRSSRSSYFATFRHQLTILSKTDALDEEKWLNMLGTFVKDWFRYESHFVHGRDSLVDYTTNQNVKKRPACSELRWAYCNHKATYFASYLTGGDCVPDDQNRSEERFSRNAETDIVCRLLLEKKKSSYLLLRSNWMNSHNATMCSAKLILITLYTTAPK